MAPVIQNHYAVLGLQVKASASEIRSAYRQLALKHHPDKNNDSQYSIIRTQKINAAWEVLRDAELKAKFDLSLDIVPEAKEEAKDEEPKSRRQELKRKNRKPKGPQKEPKTFKERPDLSRVPKFKREILDSSGFTLAITRKRRRMILRELYQESQPPLPKSAAIPRPKECRYEWRKETSEYKPITPAPWMRATVNFKTCFKPWEELGEWATVPCPIIYTQYVPSPEDYPYRFLEMPKAKENGKLMEEKQKIGSQTKPEKKKVMVAIDWEIHEKPVIRKKRDVKEPPVVETPEILPTKHESNTDSSYQPPTCEDDLDESNTNKPYHQPTCEDGSDDSSKAKPIHSDVEDNAAGK